MNELIKPPLTQSRCALTRYGKMSDAEILAKIIEVCMNEKVSYTEDGLEAIVFPLEMCLDPFTILLSYAAMTRVNR